MCCDFLCLPPAGFAGAVVIEDGVRGAVVVVEDGVGGAVVVVEYGRSEAVEVVEVEVLDTGGCEDELENQFIGL